MRRAALHALGAGLAAGLWLKRAQLALVSPRLLEFYPVAWTAECAILSALALGLFVLVWRLGVRRLAGNPEPRSFLDAQAASCWLLALPWFGASPVSCLRAFVAVQIILPTLLLWSRGRRELAPHLAALALIALVQIAGNQIVSPLVWRDPLRALAGNESIQLGALTPLFNENFVNAKAFDFSGFSQAYWGAGGAAPVGGFSYAFAFLAALAGPGAGVGQFFRLAQALMFLWCALGSFGFYLLCRAGLRLSWSVSAGAAAVWLFANPFLAVQLTHYFPLFVVVPLTLPWALLLAALAARERKPALAVASGLVFCAPLYLLPPHPETVLQGLAFLLAFAAWSRAPKVWPGLLAGLGGGAFLFALPLWLSERAGDISVFGHADAPRFAGSHAAAIFFLAGIFATAVACRLIRPRRRAVFLFFAGAGALTGAYALGLEPAAAGKAAADFMIIRRIRVSSYAVFSLFTAALFLIDEGLALLRRRSPRAAFAAAALATLAAVCAGAPNLRPGRPSPFSPFFGLPSALDGLGRSRRVIAATVEGPRHVGAVTGGLLVNNAVETIDTRFMSVPPALQSLFMLAGSEGPAGNYAAREPWSLSADEVLAPDNRRLLNIAGIDAFVFDRDKYEWLPRQQGLRVLAYSGDGLVGVVDEHSRGIAYLATASRPELSIESLTAMKDDLLRLNSGEIVEDSSAARALGAGSLSVEAVSGNKAAFLVNCSASPCILVFNAARIRGWRAFAGRTPLAIKRVNYAFMGVDVPAGESLVWFERR